MGPLTVCTSKVVFPPSFIFLGLEIFSRAPISSPSFLIVCCFMRGFPQFLSYPTTTPSSGPQKLVLVFCRLFTPHKPPLTHLNPALSSFFSRDGFPPPFLTGPSSTLSPSLLTLLELDERIHPPRKVFYPHSHFFPFALDHRFFFLIGSARTISRLYPLQVFLFVPAF